jgi:hypothetical protein
MQDDDGGKGKKKKKEERGRRNVNQQGTAGILRCSFGRKWKAT